MFRKYTLTSLVLFLYALFGISSFAQDGNVKYVEKKYNLFYKINESTLDENYKSNARTLSQLKADIQTTLLEDKEVPDSILIIACSSPDGDFLFNKQLAQARAENTKELLLKLFPELNSSDIITEYLEEDWDGLLQVLKLHKEFPQREEMIAVIQSKIHEQEKENRLRCLTEGWEYLKEHHIYSLRNSSITIKVIRTATNADDEFIRRKIIKELTEVPSVTEPKLQQYFSILLAEKKEKESKVRRYKKSIFALRTNLLVPAMNVGLEIPIKKHWSIGFDYYYPWFVSDKNLWCCEMLGAFADVKYWFTGKNPWTDSSKLKGHAVGLFAGAGYYDFQNKIKGFQGEYLDLGIDYTYALPVAKDKLRFEFNIGLGLIQTVYRPYTPSSDYTDLIKEPGIQHRSTSFFGPTRGSVSLVVPITVKTKASNNNKKGGNK